MIQNVRFCTTIILKTARFDMFYMHTDIVQATNNHFNNVRTLQNCISGSFCHLFGFLCSEIYTKALVFISNLYI